MSNVYVGKYGIQPQNDCCVVAIADFFKISYSSALKLAKAEGLTPKGMDLVSFLSLLWEITGEQPKYKRVIRDVKVSDALIFSGFIFVGKHVMAVIDGIPQNTQGYETARVTGYVNIKSFKSS